MKRSPLKRKKPMARQAMKRTAEKRPKPRKAIRRKGKQAAYYAEHAEARRAWAQSRPQVCMVCGEKPDFRGLAVHEIERRSHAKASYNPANYLLVCAPCHEGPIATMPHARQLAYKWLRDPEQFDLTVWLAIGDPQGRAPLRVTAEEITGHILDLSGKGL